jgi:thymidylate synthase (FAD)
MKILRNAGQSVVLGIWPGVEKPQQIIEIAGRTCYQSEKEPITDETASKFVRMIMRNKHFSVIEHAWVGFIFPYQGHSYLEYFYPYSKFLFKTEREKDSLISGNLETWKKIYLSGKLEKSNLPDYLLRLYPDIFLAIPLGFSNQTLSFQAKPITHIDQLESKQEILNHIALTVQFNNVSRGVTHELVRHRIPVYSQESTRYVDESNLIAVAPPHKKEFLLKIWFKLNEWFYRILIRKGWHPQDARQVLPIGTKAQIVASCNLLEWQYIFKMRTTKPAHWEIRRVMSNLLEDQLKPLFPGIFDDFHKIGEDINGLAYFDSIF